MEKKKNYGEISSESFYLGDIVEWSKWHPDTQTWCTRYGVIVKIQSKIVSNRLVSISTVMPIDNNQEELEFFSLSLRLISRAGKDEKNISGSHSNFS